MPQYEPGPPIYCVPCARIALTDYVNTDPPEGSLPVFQATIIGTVQQLPNGAYTVPVARAVADGNSVCMFHLLMPTTPNPG